MVLVNEAFVLIVTYHFYTFTDFMTDTQNRLYMGYSLVAFTCLNVAINLGVVTVETLSIVGRKLKLKYMAWSKVRH